MNLPSRSANRSTILVTRETHMRLSALIPLGLSLFAPSLVSAQTQTVTPSEVASWCDKHPGETVLVNSTASTFPMKCFDPSAIVAPPAPPLPPATQPSATAAAAKQYGCTKTIAVAAVYPNGSVGPYMQNWVEKWIKKNTKKHPNVCFSQTPIPSLSNYTIVFSESYSALTGLQAVTRTDTTTTPVSGNGTVTDNQGEMWSYTYTGNVTTTTTSTENVPYVVNNRYLFAVAFDARGVMVARDYHLYSTQTGGDPNYGAGYNIGNALGAINARGRLLNKVVSQLDRGR